MEEIWKDIEGYEGRYQVSNLGRVKSLQRVVQKKNGKSHTIPERILATHIINSGYEVVNINEKKVRKKFTVHYLVAKHFCEGWKPGLEVNHKDGNRLNNRADNLEWVTRKEQIHDVIRRGKFNVEAAHAVARIKRRKPVAQYDLEGNLIATYPSIRDAQNATGVSEHKISAVCNGHRKKAGGFVWKFV